MEFFINLINREKKKGKTIIIITHNTEFSYNHLPRTILMTDGEIIADGPTKKIFENETLISRTYLILPQIRRFCLAMQKLGLQNAVNLTSNDSVVNYLKHYMQNKLLST